MELEFDFRKSPVYDALAAELNGEKTEHRYCFDIETNGLLDTVDKFHCASIIDIDRGTKWRYGPDDFEAFMAKLDEATWLVGHNIIGYDFKAIKKLSGGVYEPKFHQVIIDTLILARMYNPNLDMHPDCPRKVWSALAGKFKNVGPHTLMNLGYIVGVYKESFGEENDFSEYCEEMANYCEQDVVTNIAIFNWLWKQTKVWSRESIMCEMEVAEIISTQVNYGWFFDIQGADALATSLEDTVKDIEDEVRAVFIPIYKPKGTDEIGEPLVVQPRVKGNGELSSVGLKNLYGETFESYFPVPEHRRYADHIEYTSGAFCPVVTEEFNLGSRQQIAERMQRAGWTPKKFTDKGNIIIDDEVLEDIGDSGIPEGILLQRYFKAAKILSMVRAWIEVYNWDTGRIHGSVNSVGAVTCRMTHSNPNVAQTPAASTVGVNGVKFKGQKEIWSDGKAPEGEANVLMTYTGEYKGFKWFKGDLVRIEYKEGKAVKFLKVVNSAEDLKSEEWSEDQFMVAGLHGDLLVWGEAGGWGADCRNLWTTPEGYAMVGADAAALELRCFAHYLNDDAYTNALLHGDIHTHNQQMAGLAKRKDAKTFIYAFLYGAGDAKIGSIIGGGKAEGKAIKTKFMKSLPKLKKLIDGVQQAVEARGARGTATVKGIDGRRVRIRTVYAALNTLLQSCGAVICKMWLICISRELKKRGLDAHFVGNIHDEVQLEVRIDQIPEVIEICEAAMPAAGRYLGTRCPLAAEAKTGASWAYTH